MAYPSYDGVRHGAMSKYSVFNYKLMYSIGRTRENAEHLSDQKAIVLHNKLHRISIYTVNIFSRHHQTHVMLQCWVNLADTTCMFIISANVLHFGYLLFKTVHHVYEIICIAC